MNLILLFGFLSILSQRVAPVCVKKTTPDSGNNAAETESKNIISTTLDTTKTITTTVITTTTIEQLPILIESRE